MLGLGLGGNNQVWVHSYKMNDGEEDTGCLTLTVA